MSSTPELAQARGSPGFAIELIYRWRALLPLRYSATKTISTLYASTFRASSKMLDFTQLRSFWSARSQTFSVTRTSSSSLVKTSPVCLPWLSTKLPDPSRAYPYLAHTAKASWQSSQIPHRHPPTLHKQPRHLDKAAKPTVSRYIPCLHELAYGQRSPQENTLSLRVFLSPFSLILVAMGDYHKEPCNFSTQRWL
jgi:hypothetical protein